MNKLVPVNNDNAVSLGDSGPRPSKQPFGYKLTVIIEWDGMTMTLDQAAIREAELNFSTVYEWGKPIRIADLHVRSIVPERAE